VLLLLLRQPARTAAAAVRLVSVVSALHQLQHNPQQLLLLLLTRHLHCIVHGSCLPYPAPSRTAEQQHASLAQRCCCNCQLQDALLLLLHGQRRRASPALPHPFQLHQQQQQAPATQLPSLQQLLQLPLLLRSQLQQLPPPQQPYQHSLLAAARLAAGLLLLLLLLLHPVLGVGAGLQT
jgi:hypothetical protein